MLTDPPCHHDHATGPDRAVAGSGQAWLARLPLMQTWPAVVLDTRLTQRLSHDGKRGPSCATTRAGPASNPKDMCVYIYIYVVLERQAFDFVCILILNYSDGLMFCLSSFRAFV